MEIQKILNYKEIFKDIESWPIWECPISEFDWEYADDEVCLILDGEIIVNTEDERITISAGEFIKFPKGLKCKWTVLKPVRKYYKFI